MIPTMTYFREALSAPTRHFKCLRSAEPLLCNGTVVVRRTQLAFESEIRWEGRNYLLFLPLHHSSTRHIEELEIVARERSRGPLTEMMIFGEELTLKDALGQRHHYDIILQELPKGEPLKCAVNHHNATMLRDAVARMKQRLDAIGFHHRNLTPSNVVICPNGAACPLRYWYAEWEVYSDNDISQLEEYIDRHCIVGYDTFSTPNMVEDCKADYYAYPNKYSGVTRLRKGNRFGFVDSDGRPITPFIYTAASNFREGRAVVAKCGKMGAIDCNGRKVVPVVYNSLEFDIKTGFFTATRYNYRYTLNYEGEIIRRTKLEEESVE